MSTIITPSEEQINIVVNDEKISINVESGDVIVNVTENIVEVSTVNGGYPLPTTVYSVFGRTGTIVATEGDYNLDKLSDVTLTSSTNGDVLSYDGTKWINKPVTGTGTVTSVNMSVPLGLQVSGNPIVSNGTLAVNFASGYSLPTTAKQTTWDTAYNDSIVSASVSGTTTKTLTLTQQDAGTITASWSDLAASGTVTSVAASVPTGMTISGSPIVSAGTLAFGLSAGYTIPLSTQLVPTGGTAGQLLTKNSATNYDTAWMDNYADWTEQLRDTVKAEVAINKGQAVYISGANGTNQLASLASNTTEATSSKTLGLAMQNLAINGIGSIITEGLLGGLNTSTATAGDPVWLGVSGNLIYGLANKPVAPAHLVYIGVVTRVNSNNGEIYVKIQNGFELREIHDVLISSVANNEGLFYESATSLWKNKSIATVLGYTPISLTSLSGVSPLSYNNTTGSFSIAQATTSANGYLSSTDWNTFNNKQASGSYITALSGEATASGPGSAAVTLSTPAVTGKLLTGVNITGGSISATDSILVAFGKIQNQINGVLGGAIYQSVWNASTNSPTLTSGTGTKGYYYIVSVAGSTNLDGITDWKVGDWAIFNGTTWDKVDNTDAVSSVNGFTGAVSLTTSNISEGTNLYYTDTRARASITLTTTGSSGAATYSGGTLNIPNYGNALTDYVTLATTQTISGEKTFTAATVFSSTTSHTGNATFGVGSPTAFDGTNGVLIIPKIRLYNAVPASIYTDLTSAATINRAIIFPDASGTVALTSDIPSLTGYVTLATAQTISGAKTFTNNLLIRPSTGYNAFFQVNGTTLRINYLNDAQDTNISAAYRASDFVWQGSTGGAIFTIASTGEVTFSSTLSNGTYTYTLPSATGTLALTSNLSSYLPLSGGTLTGTLNGTSSYFTSLIKTDNAVAFQNITSGGTSPSSLSGYSQLYFDSYQFAIRKSDNQSVTFRYPSVASTQTWDFNVEGYISVQSSATITTGSVLFANSLGKIAQNNAQFFWDNTNYRLGIGTAIPAYMIDVNGTGRFSGALTMAAYSYSSVAIQFTRANSNTISPASGNGILVFGGGNAQMRIDTSNGINFDMNNGGTPYTPLKIQQNGNTVLIDSPNNTLSLGLGYQGTMHGYLGGFSSRIEAYSNNGGYVYLSSSSTWIPASDIKRKRNFETYSLGLNAILGLEPKLYNMDFQKDGDDKQLGLIAQEVKKFIPLAFEQSADFIGLNYNYIIVTMVNAIKELKGEIDILKNK